MNEYSIREALEGELALCAAVIREAFGTVAGEFALTSKNCPTNGAFITDARLLEEYRMGKRMFVLCKEDNIIGFAEITRKKDTVYELGRLAVLPAYRHAGGGSLLLAFAKEQAKKLGAAPLTIGIIEENTRLKRWYETHGFTHTGTKRFEHLPFTVGFLQIDI